MKIIIFTDLQVCGETTASPYSKEEIKSILQDEDTVCGLYPHIACLSETGVNGCTIDTAGDKTYCTYDASSKKMMLYATVVYNTPSFSQAADASLAADVKIKFYGCNPDDRCVKLFSKPYFLLIFQATGGGVRVSKVVLWYIF